MATLEQNECWSMPKKLELHMKHRESPPIKESNAASDWIESLHELPEVECVDIK